MPTGRFPPTARRIGSEHRWSPPAAMGLRQVQEMDGDARLDARYDKFRAIGLVGIEGAGV